MPYRTPHFLKCWPKSWGDKRCYPPPRITPLKFIHHSGDLLTVCLRNQNNMLVLNNNGAVMCILSRYLCHYKNIESNSVTSTWGWRRVDEGVNRHVCFIFRPYPKQSCMALLNDTCECPILL